MNAAGGLKTPAALALILGAALAALALVTDGFRVVTSESARRLAVARDPLPLPVAHLADGSELGTDIRADGRVVLLDFIYTHCESLCTALGTNYQQLQREIRQRRLGREVRLLSLSFDPERDDPATLAHYARSLGADPALWQVDTIPDPAERAALLAAVGIVVVPDGHGDFVHNAAIHVVDGDGRLRRIHDLGAWRAALADASRMP